MTRRTLASIWLPLLAVAATVVLLVAIQGDLPDRVATHWGIGGEPDGFTDKGDLPFLAAGIMVVAGGLLAVTASAASKAVIGARLIQGIPLGTVLFIGGLILSLTLIQMDTTEAPSLPWWAVPLALALGIGGWLLGSWVAVSEEPPSTDAPAPGHAARLPLADGGTAVWTGRTPAARSLPIMALIVLFIGLVVGWLSTWAVALIFLPVLALVIGSSMYTVTAGPKHVEAAGMLFGFPRVRVPLDQVASAEAGTVEAWSFGGWGIRSNLGGESAVITRSGPALVINRTDGARLRISLDQPEEPAALISTLLDRRA